MAVFQYNPVTGELKTSKWGTGYNDNKNIEIQVQRNTNQNFKVTYVKVNFWNADKGRGRELNQVSIYNMLGKAVHEVSVENTVELLTSRERTLNKK